MKNVSDLISTLTVPLQATIRETMQAINAGALGIALLEEATSGRFAGLVTDGDIRRALLGGQGLDTPVQDIARPASKTARQGMRPEEIAKLFSEPVRVVPLLNDDDQVVDLAVFDQRYSLPVAEPLFGERELLYVSECILSGWISSAGSFVTRFEEMCADFCNAKHAVATSSGTTALHLALAALDIGPGDEVIVPSFTFIATANAVHYTGATPVFVDSTPETWTLDPDHVAAAVTAKTKAVIPVHLYGYPADMDPLLSLASQHNLAVVEDAAEAHGAEYKGQRVGALGDLGIFSFYGNKIVTTGEGGMVVTNDQALAEKLRLLRDHGMSPNKRYWHEVVGYNYRLTNLQAAVGVAQMEKIDSILSAKAAVEDTYRQHLAAVPGITSPTAPSWAKPVCWLYSVLVDAEAYGRTRDELIAALQEQDIDTRPLFPPLHTQPIYQNDQRLPVAEDLAARGLSLPSAAHLRTEDITRVCQAIADLQTG